jgi:hypothetical protein
MGNTSDMGILSNHNVKALANKKAAVQRLFTVWVKTPL